MSLKVVFDNRENKPVCTCNVCERTDKVSNRWKMIEFGVGIGYRGYEKYYFTCSKECRKKDKEENLFEQYRKRINDEWWEANEIYLEDFEKEFKNKI